jgi:hypothetical protein
MNKLTPEQALADIRAVRRDRADSHWLDCAVVLADEVSRLRGVELDNAEVDYRHCKATVRVAEALGFSESCVMGQKRQGEFALECVARLVESERLQMHGYKREAKSLREENAKLRAELDALNAEPAATETPALARFLPVRPADVPAPPDGWVYVGMGLGNRMQPSDISDDISLLGMCNSEWISCQFGTDTARHYAIRWTAEPDIWHRFGLLAPSEGGGWIPHRQGEAMPCERLCKVLLKGELDDAQFRHHPGEVRYGTEWCWDADTDYDDDNVIGWRPMIAEVAT